jgi:O-succinylbenzoate synthase
LPAELSEAQIKGIPAALPATRFGLECAWLACRDPGWLDRDLSGLSFGGLLGKDTPSGSYPVYKGKVGMDPFAAERKKLESWLERLPAGSRLRLDANGGLTLAEARQWLALCDRINREWPGKIEFFEQPLPPEQYADLIQLSREFQTPIALDESVVGLEQLQAVHRSGWQGILVVKPSLMGSGLALRDYLSQHPGLDLVFLLSPRNPYRRLAWASLGGIPASKNRLPQGRGMGGGGAFPGGGSPGPAQALAPRAGRLDASGVGAPQPALDCGGLLGVFLP